MTTTPWTVASVPDTADIVLFHWSVFEIPLAEDSRRTTRHFVGLTADQRHVRVSSPVVTFDPETRRGMTRSGRIYELSGPNGFDVDARYVWARWRADNNIQQEWDISDDVLKDFRPSTR